MNKNKLYIKEWIESVYCEDRKPSMKYNGTVNSSTKIHCSVLCMDLNFCPRFPNYWNWISPYSLIRYPCFSRRQDQTSYLYSKFLARSGYFSFSILHTHFLLTAKLLLFLLRIFAKFLLLNWWLNLQIYGFIPFP